jgi:peptidoglycan/xylan/chitin deacetylase (PgdA/CDA1 family)
VESKARTEARPDVRAGARSDAAQRPAGPAWPRRAALRAAAGLGLALPFGSAGCGSSAAPGNNAGGSGATGGAGQSGSAVPSPRATASPAAATAGANTASVGASTTASASAGGATEVAHATTTDAVALTFHGDGTPALAEALLAEAERAGAQVTVMAVGTWLDAYPQLAKRVLDGGHELGNHTQHHINISALSPNAAYAEIEACAARLRRLTGSQGRWFRPSQAQHATAQVRAAAVRAGYLDVLSYDVDPLDYTDPGSAVVIRNVLGVITPGDVVSLHMGHRGTVEALPAILDGLRTRGLRAVTADALFPDLAGQAPAAVPSQEASQP